MASCSQQLRSGRTCRRLAVQDGLCRQHWNLLHSLQPLQTHQDQPQDREPQDHDLQEPQTPPRPPTVAPAHAPPRPGNRPVTQRTPAEQAQLRGINEALQRRVPHMSVNEILVAANLLMDMWIHYEIPTLLIPPTYACLKYMSVRHPFFHDVLSATLQIVLQDSHPVFTSYTFVPQEERHEALEALRIAIEHVGNDVPEQDANDWRLPLIMQRMEQELLRPAPAPPVERDPEGGINLQAFATDAENIHRSSVQNTTREQIQQILQIPYPDEQDTLLEIHRTYQNEQTLAEIRQNCLNVSCFDVTYREVLNHVWAYIRSHTEKEELERRLEEEIQDGIGTCPNGKMCRLVNTLQGFIDMPSAPSRDVFQGRIAGLRGLPDAREQAYELFIEFQIPVEEQSQWIQALD